MKSLVNWIKFLFIALIFFTPLVFTYSNSELFELPKMYLVYAISTIILSLHLINVVKNNVPLFKKNFLIIPLLLFFVSQTISTIISIDPHTSFFGYYSRLNGGLLSLISYAVLYLVLAVYIDSSFKNKLINFSLFSGFLVSAYAIAEHFGIDKNLWVQDVQSRVFSTLGQPNWLAAYLCVLLPLSLYKFTESFTQKKHKLSIFYFLLSISYYLSLLFTKSKSGIIAALISLAVFFVLTFLISKKTKTIKSTLIPLNIITVFILLTSIFINNPIKDKLFPQKTAPVPVRTDIVITPSEDIRKIVWTGAIDLWKRYPIFGTGTETFAYTYYWTRPASHNLTSEWDFLYNKAHNEYLNFLATTGTVGLGTYLILIAVVLFLLIKNIFQQHDQLLNAVLAAYLSILITNFGGFSVVTISLFFYLLPAFLLSPQKTNTKDINNTTKLSLSKLFSIVLIIFFTLLGLSKILFFYLADISYSLADKSDSQNDYSQANQYVTAALHLNPSEAIYYSKSALINSKLAITSASEQKKDESSQYINLAINNSDFAVKSSPTNINLWKERAQTFYFLSTLDSKYFQTAIGSLSQITVLAPTDAKTYYLLGQFLEAANLKSEAIPFYQKAIDLKPNYDYAYFSLGQIYFDQKNYDLAKTNLESVLKYAPNSNESKQLLDEISKVKKK